MATELENWLQFLGANEKSLSQLIGEKYRLLVVQPDLKIVYFRDYRSDIQIDIQVGSYLPTDSSSAIAMEEKRTIRRTVPKDVFGVEIQTHTIPFTDGSGCINVVFNVATSHAIATALDEIVGAAQHISTSSDTSLEQAERVEAQFDLLHNSIKQMGREIEKLSTIYEVVNDIARRLQLISLNASIEAAHAKDYGKGFAVVAQEVRGLADQTRTEMNNVTNIIQQLLKDEEAVGKDLDMFTAYSQEQRAVEQEISKAIGAINTSIVDLQVKTKQLMRLTDD